MNSRWMLCVVCAFLAAGAAVGAQKLTIQFEEQAVVVAGVQPGGQVAWLSVSKRIEDFTPILTPRRLVIADDDQDGVVRVDLEELVATNSVWIAVDIASGAVALASPATAAPPPIDPARQLQLSRSESGGDELSVFSRWVELLWVRPGTGAWYLTAGDGGQADADGAGDGRVLAPLAQAAALIEGPDAPTPVTFSTSDLLVVLDLRSLGWAVLKAGGDNV